MKEKFEVVAVREDDLVAGDRRRSPRATCEYATEFVDPGTGRSVRGTVLDISQTGMRVRTAPMRLNDPENIRFYVWINGNLLKLSGAVVRQTLDGQFGVEFKASGETLKDRLAHHVSDAAHRNLKLELRKRVVEEVAEPAQPSVRAVARSFMRGGNTIHESMQAARTQQQSVGQKWIDRRIATHLS